MHSPHAPTALQALHTVFVLPALSRPLPKPRLISKNTFQQPQPATRPFSQTTHRSSKTRAPEQRNQKWDNEITHRILYIIDPATGKPSPTPRTRYDVLNSLDLKTHRLVQLSPDKPDDPNFVPVCKIVGKKELYDEEKRRKEQQKLAKKASSRGSDDGMKTLEINWAIDGNDLGHRLEKARAFLEEGRRVEFVLAPKKRGRRASLEECEGVMGRIREMVDGVKGARERREMEGKIGRFVTMVFQSTVVASKGGERDEN